MVAIKLVVLSLACVCATALSPTSPVTRNTIFADERLEGEIFENVDAFDHIDLTRNGVSPYRLPTTTRPSNYKVYWIVDTQNLTYSGSVDITLSAMQSNVNEIVLHSAHVNITELVLRQGNTVIGTNFTLQPEYHFLRVTLNTGVLQQGTNQNPVLYTLSIKFKAIMRDDMYGIYHSWYRDVGSDSRVRWMATTQFQATAARFAMPCYDEPSFKATFDVTITRPIGYNSWFCTRRQGLSVVNSTLPGYENDVYLTTPVMSTYLLALIVADYGSTPSGTVNGAIHEVIARRGAIIDGQGAYAQSMGMRLLARMETDTAFPFLSQSPNLKMTQAAIPDFGAGAMENWGLLTYREAYLLRTEGQTNRYFQQLIAYILSHEIAHMWFGNLVTNHWWDVVWLNEGFARYYQYFLTHKVEPSYGLGSRFITEQVHTALLSDSSNNPQPLTNPGVGSPAAVSSMFSTITYNKGAAVIRMTEHLLGSSVFETGLQNYLRDNAHGTVLPIHLFNALNLAGRAASAFQNYGADFDFVKYFESWTEQPGHPVLNVHINQVTGEMTIYQHRFNINTGFSNQLTQYIIPITFATRAHGIEQFEETKPTHILTKPVTIINRVITGDQWTIFNKQQTGFYRVNYDQYSWDLIIAALRNPDERAVIHEYNRAQIVNDVFQFARSGIMTYQRAMNILYFLREETAYTPWVAAITGFNWIRARLFGTPELQRLDDEILQWSQHVMNHVGYEPASVDEDFMRAYLRYQIAPFRCNLGDDACTNSAVQQFNRLRNDGVEVYPDNRNWVYCNALRVGSADDFNFLWNRFLNHNLYTEKILLLQVLGCTRDEESLHKFLEAIFEPNNIIRRQDYNTALNNAVSGNEANTQRVFNYIKEHLPAVMRAYDGSAVTPLSYVSARLRNEAEVLDFQIWANQSQALLNTSYNAVYSGSVSTLQSFQYAPTIVADLGVFLESGATPVVTTTLPPPTPGPGTTLMPDPGQPTTPEIPDSAATTFVSVFLLTFAVLANFIL